MRAVPCVPASLTCALASVLLVVAACTGSSNACSKDADCGDGDVCTGAGFCTVEECADAAECQASAVTTEPGCAGDADCTGAQRCVSGANGGNACVTELAPGAAPCSQAGGTVTEVSGTDTDGSQVQFCGDGAITCDGAAGHGRCNGGSFGG